MAENDWNGCTNQVETQIGSSGEGLDRRPHRPSSKLISETMPGMGDDSLLEKLPLGLNHVPDHINISPKVAQIITWSLSRRDKEEPENGVKPTNAEPQVGTHQVEHTAKSDESTLNTLDTAPDSTAAGPVATQNADGDDQSAGASKQATPSPVTHTTDYTLTSRLFRLAQGVASKISPTTDEPKTITASSLTVINPVTFGECISCFDEHPKTNLTTLGCSHDYCKDCLREVVMNAIRVESAFPPKCCLTEIPLKTILSCLDAAQRTEYKEKAAEYSIPAGHRWYCPEPSCARWLPPSKLNISRRSPQKCPYCHVNICSICRGTAHDANDDCPQDFGVEEVLEIAQFEGWRRCHSCRTMVEHTSGCRHMTCKCGAQFCYVCTAPWKTCACTESDAERRRNELRARRAERDQRIEEQERQRQVEDAEALAEYEEIEEAIRNVEAMERLEAEQRAEEERQRQEEEERLLAELEAQRVAEEAARLEEEARQEQELCELLLQSCREDCMNMRDTLTEISRYQQVQLDSEQCAKKQTIDQKARMQAALLVQEQERTLQEAHRQAQTQMDDLFKKHQKEWSKMTRELEDEEDDVFMNIQLHLRNKPNREAREQRMRSLCERNHRERRLRLQALHSQQRAMLVERCQQQIARLQLSFRTSSNPSNQEYEAALKDLAGRIEAENQLAMLVFQRRFAMLEEHQRIMLVQIEAREEPAGLTEEVARHIELQQPQPQQNTGFERITRQNSWTRDDDRWTFGKHMPAELPGHDDEDMYGSTRPGTQHPADNTTSDSLVPQPLMVKPSPKPGAVLPTPPQSPYATSATPLLSLEPMATSKGTLGTFPLTPRASKDSNTMNSSCDGEPREVAPTTDQSISASATKPSLKVTPSAPSQQVYGVTGALLEVFRTAGATGSSASVGDRVSFASSNSSSSDLFKALKDKDRKKSFFGFGKGKDKEGRFDENDVRRRARVV